MMPPKRKMKSGHYNLRLPKHEDQMKSYTQHGHGTQPLGQYNNNQGGGGNWSSVILTCHYYLILPKYPLLHICKTLVSINIVIQICCSVTLYLGAVVIVIWTWIYNYLYNQCLSPLTLWVRISIRARCTTLCDKLCQLLATGLWFSPGTPVSFTIKLSATI